MTLIGKVLAERYEIIEEIGSGGMAVVYKAKCQLLNRYVAVKVLRPDLQNDEEFVRRFNVEAQAAASLTHPNIVSIYDVGNEDGLHYIVMEYIEGKTLKEYIEEKHILPWREAVDYTIQIAKGLEQAHKNSIIHRDVKPHNIIMTTDGVMKVTDFGIARANVQATVTCEDNAIGSVHYISPEQARGGYTDERSDIYSLGVVLYEMITGTVPFDSERPVTVAIMHLQDKPIPPRELNISIPRALENIVLKAMTKEISVRHKSASELIAELTEVLNDPTRIIPVTKEEKPKAEEMGSTIVMPAVKPENVEIVESEVIKEDTASVQEEPEKDEMPEIPEKEDSEMPAKKRPDAVQKIDKKKERKVVAVAVLCALAALALIAITVVRGLGLFELFSGNETIEIPSIVGLTIEEANAKCVEAVGKDTDVKINIEIRKTVESDKKEGTIISQNPLAGDNRKKGAPITISVDVSKGMTIITLKDYVSEKRDYRVVQGDVTHDGYVVQIKEEASDDVPNGVVIRQEPAPGAHIKKGSTVTLYVSSGPEDNTDDDPDVNTIDINNPPKVQEPPKVEKPNTTVKPSPNTEPDGGKQTTPQKKSTMLTIYGPKDKDSAQVQVKVNGKAVYSKNLKKNQSDTVKLEGTSSSIEVEILYDGVLQQKGTVTLQ